MTKTDDRIARLERLTLLSMIERHGITLGAGIDPRVLREQAAADARAITRELTEPQIETRRAA